MAQMYQGLVQDIDHLIVLGEEGILHTGEVDIRRTEDMLAFSSASGGMIPRDKREQAVMERWLQAMPAVSLSICSWEQAAQGVYALMIPAGRAADYGLEESGKLVRRIVGGMALHAVTSCGEEQYENPDVIFEPVRRFAHEHRFAQKGTMYGNLLFVDCSGGVRRHYYDTYMVFK